MVCATSSKKSQGTVNYCMAVPSKFSPRSKRFSSCCYHKQAHQTISLNIVGERINMVPNSTEKNMLTALRSLKYQSLSKIVLLIIIEKHKKT